MEVSLWLLVAALLTVKGALAMLPTFQHVHTKFQYKQSFKGPYMINAKGQIPYWNHGGSAIPSEEQVRVCPSIKSRTGWVWAKHKFSHKHWMVDVTLRVSGKLKSGADGMAIWFTEQAGSEGSVFGNIDTWKGVALILDSFDNDGLHDNPKVQVVLNDGQTRYDHGSDGLKQENASCLKDFRNRPHPVKLRMIYLRGTLEVWLHDGVSMSDEDHELCAKVETAAIPVEGYFGISAATGGLSDDHDVLKFLAYSLLPSEERTEELLKMVDQEKAQQIAEQYSRQAQDFDRRHEEYLRAHPDPSYPGGEVDWQKEVETEQNMRVVADMQVQLQREIRQLATKVDLLLSGGNAVDRRESGGNVPGSISADLVQIKTTESNILHQLADLKASVDRSVPQGAKVTTSEQLQPIYETKNLVQQNSKQLEGIESHLKQLSAHQCPPPSDVPSCVSPLIFVVAIVAQLLLMWGYTFYQRIQEHNAKKFF